MQPEAGATRRLLIQAAAAELRTIGWDGESGPDTSDLLAEYTGESGRWLLTVETYPDEPLLVSYSVLPEPIPLEQLGLVIEYLTRANSGLPRANFEIDFETRIVRCKSSLDIAEVDIVGLAAGGFLRPLVKRVIWANLATVDLFLPGLNDVLSGRATPAEADAAVLEEELDD